MSYSTFLIFLCFIFLPLFGISQQNLFNIPSGDITPKKKFFYQHQINFYSLNEFESKSHVVYGLGRQWDAGINLVDIPIRLDHSKIISTNDDSSRKPLYPLLMLSLQKQWILKEEYLFLNVGTQIGPNVSFNVSKLQIAIMNYAIVRWRVINKGNLVGGFYQTNDTFVGGSDENKFGYMLGYEYKINKDWLLMGDFISGMHKKSQTVLGGGYNVSGKFQVFLGSLITFPNGKLNGGMVVEINWYGWDFRESPHGTEH